MTGPRITRTQPAADMPADVRAMLDDAVGAWGRDDHRAETWVRQAADTIFHSDTRGDIEVAVPADALGVIPDPHVGTTIKVRMFDGLLTFEDAGLYALERAMHRELARLRAHYSAETHELGRTPR